MIAADRDAVALAAHDDERLLDGIAGAVHDVVEDALDGGPFRMHALADGRELGRSLFAQLAVAGEVLVRPGQQLTQVWNSIGDVLQAGERVRANERLANGLGGADGADDLPRLVELEDGLAVEK